MTDLDFLEAYRRRARRRNRLREAVTALGDRARLRADPRGRARHDEALAARLGTAVRDLAACERALAEGQARAEAIIAEAEDAEARAALRLYYAEGLTDEQAAERLWLSPRQVSRLRRDWLAGQGVSA